jgi:hypothetical protein
MTAHVQSLADDAGILIRWIRNWRAADAYPEPRLVEIPVIRSPGDYLTCLHELGHCLTEYGALDDQRQNDPEIEIVDEGAAWAWAAANAAHTLTKHIPAAAWQQRVGWAFTTYVKIEGTRKKAA